MSLGVEEIHGRRFYRDEAGAYYVSVTQAVRSISEFLGDDEFSGVPKALLRMHALEGDGCHAVCLGWLAQQYGFYQTFTIPPKPEQHPDEARWASVMANALRGFGDWCDRRKPIPLAIEQPGVSEKYGLAGTPDCKVSMTLPGGRSARAILELKFTAALTVGHRLQVRAYHRLDGYEDCRLGVLLRIDRTTGAVEERLVKWEEEPHLDSALLNAVGLLQWGRQYGN